MGNPGFPVLLQRSGDTGYRRNRRSHCWLAGIRHGHPGGSYRTDRWCNPGRAAPTSVYQTPKSFMQHLADTNIEFSRFLNRELTTKLRAVCHAFYRSRLFSKTQCLADTLLEVSFRSGSDTISITQTQLSHLIGCSRPKIITELKVLEEQALIRTRYGKIKLMDKDGLKKVAGL